MSKEQKKTSDEVSNKTVAIIVLSIVALLITAISWGVINDREKLAVKVSQLEEIFEGERDVRRICNTQEQNSSFSGYFFLFAGAASGQSNKEQLVTFSWKLNDGTYTITKYPLEYVRIKFGNYDVPKIKFKVRKPTSDFTIYEDDMSYMVRHYISYIVILCKEEDWPSYYELPMDNMIKE